MHSLFKGVMIVIALALVNCAPPSSCPKSTKEEAKKAEVALADFAVNLFKNVSSKDENKNQAISPVSIALALTMLESGADSQTRNQLKQILLETSASSEDVLAVYQSLEEQLRIDGQKTKLTLVNGLFQQKDLKLKDDYINSIQKCLKSDVQQVDFQQQLEQTRQKINQFVSQKTSQKITELFQKNVLKASDRLVLANAVYLQASWKTQFEKSSTKQDTFYRNGQQQDKQTVPFMQQTTNLRHTSTNDLDAVELTYQNQDLAMYVVLPKQRDGLRDLEKKLTGQQLRDIISKVQEKQVQIQLPKFQVRSPVDLKNTLSRMGLDAVFSQSADFSRMSESSLKIDSCVHEACLSVDENGTEGAAASGSSDMGRNMMVQDPTTVKVDHPFMYAVVHKQTGAIVYLGKVNSVEQPQE